METKHLRTFVSVVELQGVTRAGRRLGLSQSAISQQMSALERQAGMKLFVRTGGGVRLSPAGEILLPYARQILAKVDEARQMLSDCDEQGGGVLRVGVGAALCRILLPEVLKGFREGCPRTDVRVVTGFSDETVLRLLAGELDVGLVVLPGETPRIRTQDLGRDELVAVVCPDHPWGGRRRVEPADFRDHSIIGYERQSRTFRLIDRVFSEAGEFPRVAVELNDPDAVVQLASVGLGVGIVPRWAAREQIETKRLVALSIGKHGLYRTWAVGTLEQPHRSRSIRVFLRLCGEILPEKFSVQ